MPNWDSDPIVSTLPKDLIIERFMEWWSDEEIQKLLQNSDICSPAFFPNIKEMERIGLLKKLEHKEYATQLYDQVGEKFLHAKKTKGNFVFLSKVFCAVVKQNPSKADEFNSLLEETFYYDQEGVRKFAERSDISYPFDYSDSDDVDEVLDYHLEGQAATKPKFLLALCEIMNLPDVCGQRLPKTVERKTEDVEPVGYLNPLYDFQRDVSRKIDEMLTIYSDDTSRGIVALPTGSGKTRVVVESIIDWINNGKPGQKDKKFIVWIVDRKELCQQAYDTFKTIFLAKGKLDSTLRLHVFWGNATKNLTEAIKSEESNLDDLMDSSRSARTSVIIASVGSFHSIYKKDKKRNIDADKSLRKLGKLLALAVIDEAHHALGDSYTHVLNSLGFNFRANEVHPEHARLLGLTATPFKNEKIEQNIGHTSESGKYVKSQTEQLQARFGGNDRFFWPDLENSSLTIRNYPHAILEVQKNASLGNEVKLSAERSYDQDGYISDYYWQIKIRQAVTDRAKDPYTYDTGRDLHGLEGEPSENFERWKKNKIDPETVEKKYWRDTDGNLRLKKNEKMVKETKVKWASLKNLNCFDKVGDYQIHLWVKDDDGLVSQKPDIRTISIKEPAKKTLTDNQEKMKFILKQLKDQEVLSIPKRWKISHDSAAYMKSIGKSIKFKELAVPIRGTDQTRIIKTNELTAESLELISQDTQFNKKIVYVVKKLLAEGKTSILLFSNTVDHAKLLSSLLRSSLEIRSEFITASTHADERCRYIEDFRNKKIQVLCNFDILTTGFDAPQVDAIVVARDTGSYPLYTQMIGRGLRGPKNGGTKECQIVDFSNKLREEHAKFTEEERESAWRFHDALYDEDKFLDDIDLGLDNLENMSWENSTQEEIFNEWVKDGYLLNRDIKIMYKLFIERTAFQKWKPEFWNYLKNCSPSNETSTKNQPTNTPQPSQPTHTTEPTQSPQSPKSYSDLIEFIDKKLVPKNLQANYQPVMLKVLLESNRTVANTVIFRPVFIDKIAQELKLANPDMTDKTPNFFHKVPVYGVLVNHGFAKESGSHFELNLNPIGNHQTNLLLEKLDQVIEGYKRSNAARKANETRGEEGRSDAANAAWRTRRDNETRDELEEKYGKELQNNPESTKEKIKQYRCGECGYLADNEVELIAHQKDKGCNDSQEGFSIG